MSTEQHLFHKEELSCLEEYEYRIERVSEICDMTRNLQGEFENVASWESEHIRDIRLYEEKDWHYEWLDKLDGLYVGWEAKLDYWADIQKQKVMFLKSDRDELIKRTDLVKFLNNGKPK